MDIKLFSLCDKDSENAKNGMIFIAECVGDFFPEHDDFEMFSSQKRMLVAVSQSLRAADIVVIAVQGNMYNATKRMLCAALDIKLKRDEEVAVDLAKALAKDKIKASTFDSNSKFPDSAEVFYTRSLLNCGFALASGGQHIIFLPVDSEQTAEVVFGSMYDYFGEIVEPDVREKAMRARHGRLIATACANLKKYSFKAAMANINGTKQITQFAGDLETLRSCFTFENEYTKRDSDSVEEYISATAREVMNSANTDLGIVISNTYPSDDTSLFAYIAIADPCGTRLVKVPGEKGEAADELIFACIDKLMLILAEYNGATDNGEVEEDDPEDAKLRRDLTLLTVAVTFASALIGIILALIFK